MQFLSLISYNVYIWHQWIAVRFKEWRIPFWSGDQPPNMTGDVRWQWTYTVLILLATFALAIAGTYLIEHPAAKRILAWEPKKRNQEPLITLEVIEPEEDDESVFEETLDHETENQDELPEQKIESQNEEQDQP